MEEQKGEYVAFHLANEKGSKHIWGLASPPFAIRTTLSNGKSVSITLSPLLPSRLYRSPDHTSLRLLLPCLDIVPLVFDCVRERSVSEECAEAIGAERGERPRSLSPGYISDFNPEEDEEDPEEDLADYPVDGGDNDDNESSDDDVEKDK
ncbi:hypothetical protein Tco_0528662 [Tanacetum coccineum]